MKEFEVYQITSENHWFEKMATVWLFLVRAECSCGWKTRPYASLEAAADMLIIHQARSGTRII